MGNSFQNDGTNAMSPEVKAQLDAAAQHQFGPNVEYYVATGHSGVVKITPDRHTRITNMMRGDAKANFITATPVYAASLIRYGDFARDYSLFEKVSDNLDKARRTYQRA